MNRSSRQTTVATFCVALSLGATSSRVVYRPQTAGGGSDTPSILIATFQSKDRALGARAAEEMRTRLQREHSAKQLFVYPKRVLDSVLAASGYPTDSSFREEDVRLLAKALHAEYALVGRVTPQESGNDLRVDVRVLSRILDYPVVQPLAPAAGKSVEEVVSALSREITEMLKGVPTFEQCVRQVRQGHNDTAVARARASVTIYSRSVSARTCMLQAFANKHESPDSIISVGNQILGIDPKHLFAMRHVADAYRRTGDKDRAIEMDMRMYRADPSSERVGQLAYPTPHSPSPRDGLVVVDSLLERTPTDPALLRTKWQLQLADRRFKDAIATGELLVRVDTSAANRDYFNRQIGAAQAAGDTAKLLDIATNAADRFPDDISFPILLLQKYRTMNQLEKSSLALASALRILRSMAGKATASTLRADWWAVRSAAQTIDAYVPSAEAKFYVGLASFQVGLDALQNAEQLSGETAKACSEAKLADEMWRAAVANLASTDSENRKTAESAGAVIRQRQSSIARLTKRHCSPRPPASDTVLTVPRRTGGDT